MLRLTLGLLAGLVATTAVFAQEAVEKAVEATQDSIVVNTPDAQPPAPMADETPVAEPIAEEAPMVEPAPPAMEAPSVDDVMVGPAPVVMDYPHAACCPVEVIDTRTRLSARRVYRKAGSEKEVAVCVENPACPGKLNHVALCVPCCIEGPAKVCDPRCGLLGRGKVDLVWKCGFTARVTFLPSGEAVVVYLVS